MDMNDPKVIALRAEYRRQFKENSGRDPPCSDEKTFDDLLAKAGTIAEGNLDEARRLIAAAAVFGVDVLERDRFLDRVKKAVKGGVKIADLRAIWSGAETQVRASLAPTPEEKVMLAADEARAKAEQKRLDAARLAPLVIGIAKDPNLLERMVKTVAAFGVVREKSGILATYLTATSRLLRRRCLSLLRKGAPASGKNYLIDHTLLLMPLESVVVFNSASPQALIYHGDQNPNSLKHMVVYLPEASLTLAVRHGVESDFTALLRQLISDNRISRHVAVPQKNGPPVSMEVIKNGPIAVIVTSAREDVEDELSTRLLRADSDESKAQTEKVVASILASAAGDPWAVRPSKAEIEEWRNFQRWLEAGAPYAVVVPFSAAIRAASVLPSEVRVRRDISGLIAAVAASAILHKAQRQVDVKGRVVATLADYSHAFDAFASGMAALYQPQLSAGVVALVKAIETMVTAERDRIETAKKDFLAGIKAKAKAEGKAAPKDEDIVLPLDLMFDGDVRATHKQLKAALGIASDDAVMCRVQDALTAGIIERTNPDAPRSAGARYRVKVASILLGATASVPVFPPPAMVEAMMIDPIKFSAAREALAAAGKPIDEDEDEDESPF